MDYDADGTLDWLSGSYDPGDVYLFRGLGEGRYAAVQTVLDENDTPLVHHPAELQAYHRARAAGEPEEGDVLMARVASFGSWPFPVDWDGDGDLDLLIGSFGGRVFLRLNVGTRSEPRYDGKSRAVEADGRELKVLGHADPVAADWDGDGRWDLVIGASDGSVGWYPNVGTADEPRFGPRRPLVAAKSDNKFLTQVLEPEEVAGPGVRAQICVADYDGDGRLDLLVGDYSSVRRHRRGLSDADRDALQAALEREAAAGSYEEAAPHREEADRFLEEARTVSRVWLYRGRAAEPAAKSTASEGPVTARVSLEGGDGEYEVVVKLDVEAGWHVYDAQKGGPYADTVLSLDLPAGLEASGPWVRPPSLPKMEGGGEPLWIWKGTVIFRRPLRTTGPSAAASLVTCGVSYQVCNADFCLPPSELTLTLPAPARASKP